MLALNGSNNEAFLFVCFALLLILVSFGVLLMTIYRSKRYSNGLRMWIETWPFPSSFSFSFFSSYPSSSSSLSPPLDIKCNDKKANGLYFSGSYSGWSGFSCHSLSFCSGKTSAWKQWPCALVLGEGKQKTILLARME